MTTKSSHPYRRPGLWAGTVLIISALAISGCGGIPGGEAVFPSYNTSDG